MVEGAHTCEDGADANGVIYETPEQFIEGIRRWRLVSVTAAEEKQTPLFLPLLSFPSFWVPTFLIGIF